MNVITIGNKTFEALSCERMRHLTRGFYLAMEIPVESIGMDELRILLDGNKEVIVVHEPDGTESEYTGFNAIGDFSYSKGIIHASQFCESELQAQLSLAQSKINAQNVTIAGQAEQVALLEEANNIQMSTMDSLLLDVLPAIITDAVTIAVAEALGSNSTPEE